MKHYAGLDASVKETAICIVDETGEICRELKAPSHPEDLAEVLKGDEHRQAARPAESHCCFGASPGSHHASHVE